LAVTSSLAAPNDAGMQDDVRKNLTGQQLLLPAGQLRIDSVNCSDLAGQVSFLKAHHGGVLTMDIIQNPAVENILQQDSGLSVSPTCVCLSRLVNRYATAPVKWPRFIHFFTA
jgi:hypothetical protein